VTTQTAPQARCPSVHPGTHWPVEESHPKAQITAWLE
jgi:hypothetical protein